MRRSLFALTALALGGCSLALDPGHYVGSGTDGAVDAGAHDMFVPPMDMPGPSDLGHGDGPTTDSPGPIDAGTCTTAATCPDTTYICMGGLCVSCDADGDGFISDQMRCDPAAMPVVERDCDDTNAAVHPNAPAICGDGVENSCHRNGPTTADWSAFFMRAGFAEAGPVPATFVVPAGSTTLAPALSLTTTAPPASAPSASMLAVLGYTATAPSGAFLTTAVLTPMEVRAGSVVPLPITGTARTTEVRRDTAHTVAYATVDTDMSGAVDNIVDGTYDPYGTGTLPVIALSNTSAANSVQTRIALAGGFSFADYTRYPLDLFIRTGSGAPFLTQYVAVWAGSALNPVGSGLFGGAPAFYGSANQYVLGVSGTMLADANPSMSSPIGATPAWVAGNRPAIAAAPGSTDSLAVYASGASFVFVPLHCHGAGSFMQNCATSIDYFGSMTLTSGISTPENVTATEASTLDGTAGLVAIGDVEQVVLPDGTMGRHVFVRLVQPNGGALGTGDPAFFVPLTTSTPIFLDDLEVSAVYPTHDATMPANEAYVVVAATYHGAGATLPAGVTVGALHMCRTL